MPDPTPLNVFLQGREAFADGPRGTRYALALQVRSEHDGDVEYSAAFQPEREIHRLSAVVTLPADRAWYLTADRELAEIEGSAVPPWPVGRFVVTEVNGRLTRWEFPRFGALDLTKRVGALRVDTVLIAREQCGLSTCDRVRWVVRREPIRLLLWRTDLVSLAECPWVEPFPRGSRAVMCLTDHADFDSAEKVNLLAPILAARDIRITKSVFPKSDPPSVHGFEEPGLENPLYRRGIDQLFKFGSEIAFHAFSAKAKAPALDECRRRADLLRSYSPRTWIDHGYGDYLFWRGGHVADGVALEDMLSAVGIRNYWSFFDLWDNPFGDACLYTRRRTREVLSDVRAAIRVCRGATLRRKAWFALHAMRTVIGIGNDVALRREPWKVAGWLAAWRWHRRARIIRRNPLGMYGRDGAVFPQALGRTWVFDTVMLNHLALQWAPERIDVLVHTGGILLGHSYMTCDHDYVLSNVFETDANGVRLNPAFVRALANIQVRQRAGDLLTLSFDALRRYLESFVQARLRRMPASDWRVESEGEFTYQAIGSGTSGQVFAPSDIA